MTTPHFRIFISSPSDVFAERERVERVIARLNGEFGRDLLEAIRWERSYYTAAKTFQDQIPLPSETDLVVCILWKRLGFELPPDYRRPDGTTPTGTEYEFEDAMQAARAKGTPDVLVYRKAAPVLLNAEQVAVEQAQFEALKSFWTRWFRTESGHFTAAYQSFDTTDQFEQAVEEHIRQWLGRHNVATSGVTWSIALKGSPYRGLQAFDAGHAEVFFGRRRTIERARERLADAAARGVPFLLIMGTSGSGKSSLARAGLVPRLTQPGAVAGVDVWRACTMRPSDGDTPLHALARALYRPDALPELSGGDNPTPPDFAALLASSPEAAGRAIRLALTRATAEMAAREGFGRPVEARLLLLVDQFEEALGPPEVCDAFARALAALAASGVWIVATLRSDLYAPFQACPPLLALREGGAQLDLVPPTPAELAEIVTGPAAAAGLRFDARADGTGLDEELTASASQPGALPLLQLALDALFEARDPATNLLTFAAYDALGGVAGVIERRAEATLSALDAEGASSLTDVLRELVAVTEDGVVTSRAAPAGRVARTPAAERLVAAFVAARLLIADAQESGIRVAHDALLSAWPRAAALIAADREMLRTRSRVEIAARRWAQEGRLPDFLLPAGRPLAEAVELRAKQGDTLDATATAFIAASQDAEAARQAAEAAHAQRELRLQAEAQQARADAATRIVRRTRVAVGVVAVLLLLAVGAAFLANTERREAQLQTAEANRQTAAAQRNFSAALDGGASLVDMVNGHLRDGGMTRDVARGLLGTAETTFGALVEKESRAADLPPPLQDTQSRLQASLSSVQLAVCDSVGAHARARDAVAVADAVEAQAPSDARMLAVVQRLDTLGLAAAGDGDSVGAKAAYARAEQIVANLAGVSQGALAVAAQSVRRDLATLKLGEGDQDGALTLVQDDLAFQEKDTGSHPDSTEPLALQAFDLRRIGTILLGKSDLAGAGGALEREKGILEGLVARQPASVEWLRALSINARQRSILAWAKGDKAAGLALARQAADMAGSVAARDPGNAEWQRDLVIADVNLAAVLAKTNDIAGMQKVVGAALAAIDGLTGPQSSSLLCQGDAARLHTTAGAALSLSGDTNGAVGEYEAALKAYATVAAAAPDDPIHQHEVAAAQLALAQSLFYAGKPELAANHDRAGIEIATRLVAANPTHPEWQKQLAALRLDLGDALRKAGDLDGAFAAYQDNQTENERLAAMQPNATQWPQQIVESLLRVAETRLMQKQPDAQWAALQAASAIAERLVAAAPADVDARRSLIQTRQSIAAAELVRREFPSALDHYKGALTVADALLAEHPDETRFRLLQAIALTYVGLGYKFNQQPDEGQAYMDRGKAALDAVHGTPPKP
jgi:tetratricopeptide (TPR) repeat protein